jgi:hypothetical protein
MKKGSRPKVTWLDESSPFGNSYFGHVMKVTEVKLIFGVLFPQIKLCFNFGFCYILVDFFKKSFGHTGQARDF